MSFSQTLSDCSANIFPREISVEGKNKLKKKNDFFGTRIFENYL